MVDGWDSDVIAEDHHMFIKCMMASYWEQVHDKKEVTEVSKIHLEPIWLPVTSYLVEDSRGAWASTYARFQQARRHAQGIAELSYAILQWLTLKQETKDGSLPTRVHRNLGAVALKYSLMTCLSTLQTFLTMCTMGYLNYWATVKMLQGNFHEEVSDAMSGEDSIITNSIYGLLLFTPMIGGIFTLAGYSIVAPSIEGLWCPLNQQADAKGVAKKGYVPLTAYEKLCLVGKIWVDFNIVGHVASWFFGAFPIMMAAFGLSKSGHKFEYIVAAKPEGIKVAGSPIGNVKKDMFSSEEATDLRNTV
jgi:hypothetical protein